MQLVTDELNEFTHQTAHELHAIKEKEAIGVQPVTSVSIPPEKESGI